MTNTRTLSGKDIHNLVLIEQATIDSEHLEGDTLRARLDLIGNIMQENVVRLQLDEEINHLLTFARCTGCETLSQAVKEKHYPSGCWGAEPRRHYQPNFLLKIEGKSRPSSIVYSLEKQKIGMAMIILAHMKWDPRYAKGAKKMLHYIDENNLWTVADGEYLFA
ncbi:hypothetical protein UNDYM_4174 [Undibacterium sp. YM2]|uniref:hypothetical protein n=1 Tax=Undibacterium sp. YM2 TaxID=2058625 RepID=UPI001331E0AB|nr:hypothetical protein [Undibacterium sp. YM2]BBB68427.1 hypothetical protein UNDYM_4174 [Undibacterium sp. YM2]